MENKTNLKDSPLLTEKEAAAYIRMSIPFLRVSRCRGMGGPPFIKIGRSVRYEIAALESWLNKRRVDLV